MIFDYRIDIIRKGIKIGELIADSCNIKFKKSAEVTRSMQIDMLSNFTKMAKIQKKYNNYIYFDGTRFFDGTWCFVSSIYKNEILQFNMFTDRLKPYLIYEKNEYPLGVFMVIAAPEKLSITGDSTQIEAYDETMILKQSCLLSRVLYAAGTKYLTIIQGLLTECGFANVYVENCEDTLQTDREFEPSTSYLEIINTLLAEINYNNVYADSNGNVYLNKKTQKTVPDFKYDDKKKIKIIGNISKNTDVYDLPNVITGIVSNPDTEEVWTYTAQNDDVNSQISTVNRGYKVMKVYELDNIASELALKEYIDQKRLEASQITETLNIKTVPEGNHEFNTLIQIDTSKISGLYQEVGWQIDFGTSGTMTHELERKVFI